MLLTLEQEHDVISEEKMTNDEALGSSINRLIDPFICNILIVMIEKL